MQRMIMIKAYNIDTIIFIRTHFGWTPEWSKWLSLHQCIVLSRLANRTDCEQTSGFYIGCNRMIVCCLPLCSDKMRSHRQRAEVYLVNSQCIRSLVCGRLFCLRMKFAYILTFFIQVQSFQLKNRFSGLFSKKILRRCLIGFMNKWLHQIIYYL